eukprot:gene19823-21762_t
MAAIDKNVLGLLNGLAKREYYNEEEITNEFLHSELFPDTEQAEFEALIKKFANIMQAIVSSDMDFRQLEAFLTSQMQRKDKAIKEDQAAAIARFWKNHKSKVHNVMVERSTFGNRLKQSNWRIDYKTHSKDVNHINAAVAIYELEIEKQDKKTEKMIFEINATQLDDTLNKFQTIKEKITLLANN